MATSISPSADPQASGRHRWLVLSICCLSLLIIGMDVTIVNVALPAIGHDLHASVSELQWTVAAYTVVLASLLMLADRPLIASVARACSSAGWCCSRWPLWLAAWRRASGG